MECEDLDGGQNASYIPQLERYDPKLFTVSVCTVDGQQFTIGDKGTVVKINLELESNFQIFTTRYNLHRNRLHTRQVSICMEPITSTR